MAHSKDVHYWSQLRSALTGGHWESTHPALTPKGISLSWSELFRKFRKHNPHHAETADAASQIQALSLLLSPDGLTATDLDGERVRVQPKGPFDLGDECILPEERREEAQRSYETLRRLNDSEISIQHASAYFAFALDQPKECLTHLEAANVPGGSKIDGQATLKVPGPPNVHAGASVNELPPPSLDIEDGKAWSFIEKIRSCCLEGMAHEKLSQDPSAALSAYDRGVTQLAALSIPRSLPIRPGRANFESFTRYRELWRWAERLLWRAIILSSRYRDLEYTMRVFRVYATHSPHWPASFRSAHRSTVSTLYLRALTMLASFPSVLFPSKVAWTNEARSVVHEYRAILAATTHFPRAGERNMPVEEFVDLCVAVWEAGGSMADQASWVLDILWFATRLTFNSQRVFRHMSRLFYSAGEHDLAKRTLRLYVQVTNKAREAGGSSDCDDNFVESDRLWVQTLFQGARMLCRIPGDNADAREAAKLVEEARARLDESDAQLVACLDLADGICKSTLALRDQDPKTRSCLLSECLNLIKRSIERHPTPTAHYHAALAYARPGLDLNVPQAIEHARLAVEGAGKEVRYWHLLALLEAKTGDWRKAKGVLEVAIDMTEDMTEDVPPEESRENGISIKDFAQGNTPPPPPPPPRTSSFSSEDSSGSLLAPSDDRVPPAATLLKPLPDHPPPSHRELFEHALQLRMSYLALTEYVEGPERADSKWLEVFEWYAARRDVTAQTRSFRPSIDDRPIASQASDIGEHTQPQPSLRDFPHDSTQNGNTAIESTTHLAIPAGIAINYTPPTPDAQSEKPRLEANSTKSKGNSSKKDRQDRRSHSQSPERERDREKSTTGKKVQRMLKDRVHKSQARFNTISKKIGHGVVRGGSSVVLHRSNSAPDFHAVLARAGPYQASSIHSRKRVISWGPKSHGDRGTPSPVASGLPLPPLPPLPEVTPSDRSPRERRMLSDLWLMSAATFRRLGKIEQARGAIREAEILDDENEAVWVQLGLYYAILKDKTKAIESFHKALFISPDDPSALVHLCRQYLSPETPSSQPIASAVDLATGMLEVLTRRGGWDIPEAWYLLAKAYGLQGRKARERECLAFALGLVETRGVRDVGVALGNCL
ncbi:hypothetical protein BD410DRAFT_790991 [Rickenella mellea]|uniref:TPR-like protein n=1 Tax=Rickenella mellea TaxID=50990 RepID=A0A4Y7PYK5_9AGAM|nr:hypothetical protein BD410DRAFT_790991 [Rickenella mellea]